METGCHEYFLRMNRYNSYNISMDKRKSSAKTASNLNNSSTFGGKPTPELDEGPFYMPGSPEKLGYLKREYRVTN